MAAQTNTHMKQISEANKTSDVLTCSLTLPFWETVY